MRRRTLRGLSDSISDLRYVQLLTNVVWVMSSTYRQIERMFSICFSVAVKKAMDPKLCLCLMLIILGTFTVQGAIPKNKKKNPFEVSARQIRECFFDPLMSKFINFFLTA